MQPRGIHIPDVYWIVAAYQNVTPGVARRQYIQQWQQWTDNQTIRQTDTKCILPCYMMMWSMLCHVLVMNNMWEIWNKPTRTFTNWQFSRVIQLDCSTKTLLNLSGKWTCSVARKKDEEREAPWHGNWMLVSLLPTAILFPCRMWLSL